MPVGKALRAVVGQALAAEQFTFAVVRRNELRAAGGLQDAFFEPERNVTGRARQKGHRNDQL